MPIPHRIRSFARESFRSAIMHGHYATNRGGLYAQVGPEVVTVYLVNDKGACSWKVPIAASWL
jgi:hypothetical protein